MKNSNLFIVAMFACLAANANAQSPDCLWAKSLGGPGNDNCRSMVIDSQGNIYTTGNFSETVDFDPGIGVFNLTSFAGPYNNIFISKLDSSGNFLWARQIGGTSFGGDIGLSIALDPSGSECIYLTGYFSATVEFDPGPGVVNLTSVGVSDIFVAKLNSLGNLVWAKAVGGTYFDMGNSLDVDNYGNVYCTGHFYYTADFDPGAGVYNLISGAGSADIFVLKLDSSGNFVWAKRFGGANTDEGSTIKADPMGTGGVYFTGWFLQTVDFDPGPGTYNLTTAGIEDVFICKLDSSGTFIWAKQMGGSGADYGHSMVLESASIYVTGAFSSTADFDPGPANYNLTSSGQGDIFISRLDTSGNFLWANATGGTSMDAGYDVLAAAAGNPAIYATGYFQGTVDFDPGAGIFNLTSTGSQEIYISKLDASGNFLWAKAIGGINGDYGSSLALSTSGALYTAGYFASPTISCGSTTLTNDTINNTSDIFIAKLDTAIFTGNSEIEIFSNGILLFPNPATNYFYIDLGRQINNAEIIIADVTGKIVFATRATEMKKLEVNTKCLAEGIYVVRVHTEYAIETKKLIVAK